MMVERTLIQVGERRGKLTLIAKDASGTQRHPRYQVRCDCGKEYVIGGTTFRSALACAQCNKGGAKRKYGDRTIKDLKLYHSWISMRRRCNPDVEPERNQRWAGRGIVVCREWENSFTAFEAWALSHGYKPGLSLDRIDNDGNYEPANCEWVTRAENSRRARALYHFVPRVAETALARIPYDDPCYGDY